MGRDCTRYGEREEGGGGLEGKGAAATMTNVHAAEWCSMQKICIARLLGYVTKGNEAVISLWSKAHSFANEASLQLIQE